MNYCFSVMIYLESSSVSIVSHTPAQVVVVATGKRVFVPVTVTYIHSGFLRPDSSLRLVMEG